MLDSLSLNRTELVARWQVRSMQPEVGQEDREGQENLRPGDLVATFAVTPVDQIIQSYQSQRDGRL
ncbi:hypothetical protein GCM10023156_40950 [Novipirellula rosea]|uniref:Uncharacterized protein n=1 Tax=Novipirellula rosea TaxID=1031540 RepID=A0ABP8N5I5_9BACT